VCLVSKPHVEVVMNEIEVVHGDPREQARELQELLARVRDSARSDVAKVDDAKAQALFETIAEVVTGLITALTHFDERSEPAWR